MLFWGDLTMSHQEKPGTPMDLIQKARHRQRNAFMTMGDIQRGFFKFIFEDNASIESATNDALGSDLHNLKLYRSTKQASLVSVIYQHFKRTLSWLSPSEVSSILRSFVIAKPPADDLIYLHEYGRDFPLYFSQLPEMSNYGALQDLAQWEWICHWLQFEDEDVSLVKDDAAEISSEDFLKLTTHFHPTVRLLMFNHDLEKILSIKTPSLQKLDEIEETGCFCLMVRHHNRIHCHYIDQGTWAFVQSLIGGLTLEKSMKNAHAVDALFDTEKMFQWLLKERCFVGIDIPGKPAIVSSGKNVYGEEDLYTDASTKNELDDILPIFSDR